ncbi:MAG: hypothetical protein UU37_C0001G0048 [Candidatus Gottesmanbacteria bacterium GW2011_GWA2_41_12]|uniref:Uncharacterized protein n=1 Tax=Candidatus Gottesmanbacteria bacterium GW2011_GWA2_41_12 TaxID=1618440 RepID=A0A0G0UIL6_9BACT|nr:MAG: hypothetical protein UU37_C0001G0048 [Candidatus Gottesmanbacteria bacterium GW2011_GWA2_41_12]
MDFLSAFISLPKIYLFLLILLSSALSYELIYFLKLNKKKPEVKNDVYTGRNSVPTVTEKLSNNKDASRLRIKLVMILMGLILVISVIPLSNLIFLGKKENNETKTTITENIIISPPPTSSCRNIKFYTDSTSWIGIPSEELSSLKPGDKIAIAVVGSTDNDMARIRVNGSSWQELTNRRLIPDVTEFYDKEYLYEILIPASGKPDFTVEAELHDKTGWH